MTEENTKTGPELYALGVKWLNRAAGYWGSGTELTEEVSTIDAATIAAAAFAGAHAAALGTLAAAESEDETLQSAWRAAVGDTSPAA